MRPTPFGRRRPRTSSRCELICELLPYLEGWSVFTPPPSPPLDHLRSRRLSCHSVSSLIWQESLRLEKTARSELAEFRLATRNRQVCHRRHRCNQPPAASRQPPAKPTRRGRSCVCHTCGSCGHPPLLLSPSAVANLRQSAPICALLAPRRAAPHTHLSARLSPPPGAQPEAKGALRARAATPRTVALQPRQNLHRLGRPRLDQPRAR